MARIRTYLPEVASWVFVGGYMGYIWIYYSWQAFIINALFGVLGYMAVYYFGDLMPIIGPSLRRPKRESGGQQSNQPNSRPDIRAVDP